MTPQELVDLAHLRGAGDLIDRDYARPLDVPAMARTALMSPAHFSRKFRAAYGETPYSYLMTRRIERAKAFLRQGKSVTDTCVAVGCTSLGSFSARFTEIVGVTPSEYRGRDHRHLEVVPSCVIKVGTRPRQIAAQGLTAADLRRPRRPGPGRRRRADPPRHQRIREQTSQDSDDHPMSVTISAMFISVHDPDAASGFYRDALGLEVRADVASEVSAGSPLATRGRTSTSFSLSRTAVDRRPRETLSCHS